MTGKHQIIVSAENNAYTGWQCKLFYFSCVTRMNHQPIIIVHDSGHDWHPDFYDLAKAGCALYPAPSYRVNCDGDDYAPRNSAGSLIHAAELFAGQDVLIVLCDPDMIFARPVEFPEILSGEFSSFMNYDRDFVAGALTKLRIERATLDPVKESLRCSVPYVVPVTQAHELGTIWLKAVDAFSPRRWEDIMYAFGLAVVKLGLKLNVTHLADHNYWPDAKLKGAMIHYAYGDERWTKRNYFREEAVRDLWNPTIEAPEETIMGELLAQIREAREFYRDAYFPNQQKPARKQGLITEASPRQAS
ncbi:MAG TPA: hypothetical protein VGJ55_19185 [Pyrinomonadaceae bacterium]|jgi:hypothetical protein